MKAFDSEKEEIRERRHLTDVMPARKRAVGVDIDFTSGQTFERPITNVSVKVNSVYGGEFQILFSTSVLSSV
jgi:hypothetical protein